jgi:hypothetical protein
MFSDLLFDELTVASMRQAGGLAKQGIECRASMSLPVPAQFPLRHRSKESAILDNVLHRC